MRNVGGGLLVLALAVIGVGAGCASEQKIQEQVLRRAAFDLNCDKEQMTIVRIDGRTHGVRGCGKRATYVKECHSFPGGASCMWVMNGASRDGNEAR